MSENWDSTKGNRRSVSASGGETGGSSSTTATTATTTTTPLTAAATAFPTALPATATIPAAPRIMTASGGFLMAGPLSGPFAGVVRIRTPHAHDVLCGRGGSINSHPGNIRFREWVKVRKEKYNLATSKVAKARMCRDVFDLVLALNPPGRFLQRMDDSSGVGGTWWMQIGEQKALAKTSQALREGAPKIRELHKGPKAGTTQPSRRIGGGGANRGIKRKAAAKEPPAKRAKRSGGVGGGAATAVMTTTTTTASTGGDGTEVARVTSDGNDRPVAMAHPGESVQTKLCAPAGLATSEGAVAATRQEGLSRLPFYVTPQQPLPHMGGPESSSSAVRAAPVALPAPSSTLPLPHVAVTPGVDMHAPPPALMPVSPMLLSPIGNGSIPVELEPSTLSIGDPGRAAFADLAPEGVVGGAIGTSSDGMKRSHSLVLSDHVQHELEGGNAYEFKDPFQNEEHILSGRALKPPDSHAATREEGGGNNDRSVPQKRVHNIIEQEGRDDEEGAKHDDSSGVKENCFCLCSSPGDHCICGDLADHFLHRNDGLDELNLISGC